MGLSALGGKGGGGSQPNTPWNNDGVQSQLNQINNPSTATIDPGDMIGSSGNYTTNP